MSVGMVKIGDYVQLKSLSVAKYNNQGSDITNAANLKVKVVGINPYKSTSLNGTDAAKAHVVFQFEKVVTTRRMRASGSYYGGSEMQTYLTGNFYNGLKTAGVPDGVVWAVTRRIRISMIQDENLSDKVFLPTEWEVFGTNNYAGSESGQGRLSAYQSANDRKKYNLGSSYVEWWLTSPYFGNPYDFCYVDSSGGANENTCPTAYGVAPAFCIK
jgi:hypothetical protein